MATDTAQLLASLKSLNTGSFKNDEERVVATEVLRETLARVERPVDQFYRMTWMDVSHGRWTASISPTCSDVGRVNIGISRFADKVEQPAYTAVLKIAVDTDLFTKWVNAGSSPKTTAELSKLSGIEESLLARILRHMAAMKGLDQPEEGTFALTPLTKALTGDSGFKDTISMILSQMYPGFTNLPSFLAKTGYKEPHDPNKTNWQDLQGGPETYIQWIGSEPGRIQKFHNVMLAYNSATPAWVDLYPTQQLVEGLKPDRAVLVDIGASKGGDLVAFRNKHPGLPEGSLILQDLPHIISALQAPEGLVPMVQNVFEPQQVKGARAYFMHFVLHGFNDEQSLTALKNLAAVMEKGYSKVLLHEAVVDEERPLPTATSLDLTMMVTLSARERTKSSWVKLIEDAGLKVSKIYSVATINEAIIEAELP